MYHSDMSGLSVWLPVQYPLKNISIPIHLIYGTVDSLVDIDVMESQLPKKFTSSHAVLDHEHLDNIWGRDVRSVVFPLVLAALEPETVIPSPVGKPE